MYSDLLSGYDNWRTAYQERPDPETWTCKVCGEDDNHKYDHYCYGCGSEFGSDNKICEVCKKAFDPDDMPTLEEDGIEGICYDCAVEKDLIAESLHESYLDMERKEGRLIR